MRPLRTIFLVVSDLLSRFIDSEADLDAAIKSLLPLAQSPVLAYPELVSSGHVARLIGLLSHENADIVIDVVEVINELTDEDVGNEGEEDEEEEGSKEQALKTLIESLVSIVSVVSKLWLTSSQLENSILELLVDNLKRLNETEESDRQGVFHILGLFSHSNNYIAISSSCFLGIFENLLGFNADLSQQLVSKTTILKWLLARIQSKNHDENRGYAAELLSILLQNNRDNRLALGREDGVEIFLKVLSVGG